MNTSMTIAPPQITSSGPRCLSGGSVIAGEAPRALHEHLARVAQVRGEEDDDRDLAELGRLEGDRADADAQVGAVDLLADARHARQQEQQQPGRGDRVAVALEHAEVAQEDDRGGEQHEPDHEPLRLLARERLVDPVDHDQAEARQHRDEREQVRVRVGQRDADHQVAAQAQREEGGAVGERHVGELGGLLDEDRGEARGEQQRRRDEREQLPVAGAHSSWPFSSAITRSSASSRARHSWSSEARAAGRRHVGERHAGAVVALVEVDRRTAARRAARGRS